MLLEAKASISGSRADISVVILPDSRLTIGLGGRARLSVQRGRRIMGVMWTRSDSVINQSDTINQTINLVSAVC